MYILLWKLNNFKALYNTNSYYFELILQVDLDGDGDDDAAQDGDHHDNDDEDDLVMFSGPEGLDLSLFDDTM